MAERAENPPTRRRSIPCAIDFHYSDDRGVCPRCGGTWKVGRRAETIESLAARRAEAAFAAADFIEAARKAIGCACGAPELPNVEHGAVSCRTGRAVTYGDKFCGGCLRPGCTACWGERCEGEDEKPYYEPEGWPK